MIIKNKYTKDECYFNDIFDTDKWPFTSGVSTALTVVSITCLLVVATLQVVGMCVSFGSITVNSTLSSLYNTPNQYITHDYKDDISYWLFVFMNGGILLSGIFSLIPVMAGAILLFTYKNSSADQLNEFDDELYSFFKDILFRNTSMTFDKARAYLDKVFVPFFNFSHLRILVRVYRFIFIASIIALINVISFTFRTDILDDKILKAFVTNGILTQQTVYNALQHKLSKPEIIQNTLAQINRDKDYNKTIVYVPCENKFMTREDFIKFNNKRIENEKLERDKNTFKITVNKEAFKNE